MAGATGPLSHREHGSRHATIGTVIPLVVFKPSSRSAEKLTTWGRENRVPQSADPVMVSARISRSLSGRLRTLLFRLNPLFIEVTRKSGKVERYRALRANFADGVIINELPEAWATSRCWQARGARFPIRWCRSVFKRRAPASSNPPYRSIGQGLSGVQRLPAIVLRLPRRRQKPPFGAALEQWPFPREQRQAGAPRRTNPGWRFSERAPWPATPL